jgi:hypothetical protein
MLKCLDCDIPLEGAMTPEHPLCERCLRRDLHDGRGSPWLPPAR